MGVGSLLVEGEGWPNVLDDYSDRLYALGRIPLFPRDAQLFAAASGRRIAISRTDTGGSIRRHAILRSYGAC
ncbi:hypothetical protein [Microbacterium halimionae]|uniref:hypothetical protein n=1 Tax=Microbacterium halimionae TaxID=1526413 RepID=UPI001C7266C3|nr:hypothetical protein [Microbacterium halimionae]